MTLSNTPWLGPVLSEYFTLFQLFQIANPYFRHADFTPVGHNSTGHKLEAIIIEKDTIQVVDVQIDRPMISRNTPCLERRTASKTAK